MASGKFRINTIGNDREIIAIIPARGGSKGIPRKNLVSLAGKPLIAHTIDVAVHSTMITKVVVSTDDQEIAETSRKFGAEVPFMRPVSLAQDSSNLNDAVMYTLEQFGRIGWRYDVIVIMMPTHPFRSVKQVDGLLGTLLSGYTMVCSMRDIPVSAVTYFTTEKSGHIAPIFRELEHRKSYFRSYGCMTAYNCTNDPAIRGFYMHRLDDPFSLIDIDTYEDLEKAEMILRNGYFDFGMP